ncbi:MAG TPA: hypothetical protein VFJ06_13285 [Halococcus sp.]|nr:hypothetical protein [Halococcus sp.]
MNYDSITDARRRIARRNERVRSQRREKTTERIGSLAVRLLAALAVVVAVAWAGMFVASAFGGLLAAVVGFGMVWLVPWLVITGVVRVLERTE